MSGRPDKRLLFLNVMEQKHWFPGSRIYKEKSRITRLISSTDLYSVLFATLRVEGAPGIMKT